MEYVSAQQITKSSEANGLEESILEKRQGLVSEGIKIGLVDMGINLAQTLWMMERMYLSLLK